MLHFFPSTFPDETLYSRLARYHRLSGHPADRASLQELVGLHTHVITSDLPSLLQALVSRIPTSGGPSVEEIVSANTIFPYFQRFLPPERCRRAVTAMSGASTSGLKTALGLMASRLGGKNTFRFCRSCLDEDRTTFGLAYWHRVHQLPGAWVCPRHAQALSELDCRTVQLKRHKLFLPDDPAVELASHAIALSSCQVEAVLRISLLSQAVLLAAQVSRSIWSLNDVHRANAKRNSLIRSNGRIRVDELAGILALYVSDFPAFGEYAVLHRQFLNWALRLLRKPRGVAVHPMKHLLLMDCLRGESPDSLENTAVDPAAAVIKPGGRHQIDQARIIDMLGGQGATLRHAAAELGVSATTLAIEAARLGLPVGSRPKSLTEDVMSRVCNALRSGLSPKEVADKHGLSQVSVYRILRMDTALSKEYAEQRFQQRRDACRERFTNQTSDRADYTWLRRHDKAWLTDRQALAGKRDTQREPCVDWDARDRRLAQRIAEVSDSMRSSAGKPRWISRAVLEREAGLADTIERNADKLPMTHAALSAHAESREEYQSRRLYWAANELNKWLHRPPPRWQLLRQAGIRVLAKENEKLLSTLASY